MLLIYGVTGYTGRLMSDQAEQEGVPHYIAGRNHDRLAALSTELDRPYRCFSLEDIQDPTQRARIFEGVSVVLNAAGPFGRTAPALIRACLAEQVHYLDLAGEVPEFLRAFKYHTAAQEAGITLIPGVGFGVVPTDLIAKQLHTDLPTATRLTLAFETLGSVSRGTLNVLLKDLFRPGYRRVGGVLKTAYAAEQQRIFHWPDGQRELERHAVYNPWRADLMSAFISTKIPTIETYTVFPTALSRFMIKKRVVGFWEHQRVQRFLSSLTARLPEGPTNAQLEQGHTRLWGMAYDAKGNMAEICLKGPEAYVFTALTAVEISKRLLAGPVSPGFSTPSQVMGFKELTALPGVKRLS